MNIRRIAHNSAWLFVGRLATAGLNLLLTILIARYLGEAGYGQYAFIVSLVYLGNTATTFGMDTMVMRAVAGSEETPQLQPQTTAALLLQLALSLVYMIVLAAISLAWEVPRTPLLLYLLTLIPLAFGTIYSAILRGRERMDLYTGYTFLGALLQTAGTAFVLWSGGGLQAIALTALVAQTGATLLASRLTSSLGWHFIWEKIDRSLWRTVFQTGSVLAVLAILAVIMAQLPIFMLRALTDDVLVGQFSAAGRLVDGTKIIPAALFGALFPQLVRGANRTARYAQLFWGLVVLFITRDWYRDCVGRPCYPIALCWISLSDSCLTDFTHRPAPLSLSAPLLI